MLYIYIILSTQKITIAVFVACMVVEFRKICQGSRTDRSSGVTSASKAHKYSMKANFRWSCHNNQLYNCFYVALALS